MPQPGRGRELSSTYIHTYERYAIRRTQRRFYIETTGAERRDDEQA
jgi:hypothetical protein